MRKTGEVIEAGTGNFLAQCYKLNEIPPLGSLVRTRDSDVEIYGIVAGARTRSIEPGRHPIARGEFAESEEAVHAANPQLAHLLSSEFTAIVAGHKQAGRIRHYLPPRPARIHSFVYLCDPSEVRGFSISLDFIDMLSGAEREYPVDEVIPACLRSFAAEQPDPNAFLVRAGKQLTLLLGDQYQRLNSILKRLK